MKNKTIDENVEYVDFEAMSRAKKAKSSDGSALHTNPLLGKFFKFLHTDLNNKFNPDDLK